MQAPQAIKVLDDGVAADIIKIRNQVANKEVWIFGGYLLIENRNSIARRLPGIKSISLSVDMPADPDFYSKRIY